MQGGTDTCLPAQGVEYTTSMTTGWKPPARIRRLKEDDHQAVRDKFHIIAEGDLLVPPVTVFEDLKMPPGILRQLASKKISKPTPIQMQHALQPTDTLLQMRMLRQESVTALGRAPRMRSAISTGGSSRLASPATATAAEPEPQTEA